MTEDVKTKLEGKLGEKYLRIEETAPVSTKNQTRYRPRSAYTGAANGGLSSKSKKVVALRSQIKAQSQMRKNLEKNLNDLKRTITVLSEHVEKISTKTK